MPVNNKNSEGNTPDMPVIVPTGTTTTKTTTSLYPTNDKCCHEQILLAKGFASSIHVDRIIYFNSFANPIRLQFMEKWLSTIPDSVESARVEPISTHAAATALHGATHGNAMARTYRHFLETPTTPHERNGTQP